MIVDPVDDFDGATVQSAASTFEGMHVYADRPMLWSIVLLQANCFWARDCPLTYNT